MRSLLGNYTSFGLSKSALVLIDDDNLLVIGTKNRYDLACWDQQLPKISRIACNPNVEKIHVIMTIPRPDLPTYQDEKLVELNGLL